MPKQVSSNKGMLSRSMLVFSCVPCRGSNGESVEVGNHRLHMGLCVPARHQHFPDLELHVGASGASALSSEISTPNLLLLLKPPSCKLLHSACHDAGFGQIQCKSARMDQKLPKYPQNHAKPWFSACGWRHVGGVVLQLLAWKGFSLG